MTRATATVWALEKDEFWVVLPNTTECTFTCGTEPHQTRQMKGQHRVRLGDKCGMSSMHFSLRPATQADGRKITIQQAVVNFTGWQEATPEEEIFRAVISDNGYQTRANKQLERGESGQNWPLIILAILLAVLAAGIVAAGAAVFMLRRRIMTELFAATLAPTTTDEITTVVQTTTEEPEVKKGKATGTKPRGQRSCTRSHEWREDNEQRALARPHERRQEGGIPMGLVNKREERTFEGLENLTKFMVSPQHSMGDGYARRPCDNCWYGKSTRDVDKGVLSTYCTASSRKVGNFLQLSDCVIVWPPTAFRLLLLQFRAESE
jgi:hypothetical protein